MLEVLQEVVHYNATINKPYQATFVDVCTSFDMNSWWGEYVGGVDFLWEQNCVQYSEVLFTRTKVVCCLKKQAILSYKIEAESTVSTASYSNVYQLSTTNVY